jgi:hypothetical protein
MKLDPSLGTTPLRAPHRAVVGLRNPRQRAAWLRAEASKESARVREVRRTGD